MDRDTSQSPENRWRPLLRRADQATVAVLMGGCFCALLLHWIWQLTFRSALIDIDRAEPLAVQFQIQINQADWPEFTLLPGIGETLARRIVEYRTRHGHFRSIEQLERVKGIGPKTMRRIGPYLRVD